MRKLLTVALAALVAGTALVACDRMPQQPTTTQESELKASHEAAPGGGMMVEPAWGNGHLWRVLIPKTVHARLVNSEGVMAFGHPSNEASLMTLYQIGPAAGDDGTQTEDPIPHDHVIPVPRNNKGSFSGNCHIKVVLGASGGEVATSGPGFQTPIGTLYQAHAADADGDGDLEDLTSVEKVRAAEDRGHVLIASTPLVFTCPVKDIEG